VRDATPRPARSFYPSGKAHALIPRARNRHARFAMLWHANKNLGGASVATTRAVDYRSVQSPPPKPHNQLVSKIHSFQRPPAVLSAIRNAAIRNIWRQFIGWPTDARQRQPYAIKLHSIRAQPCAPFEGRLLHCFSARGGPSRPLGHNTENSVSNRLVPNSSSENLVALCQDRIGGIPANTPHVRYELQRRLI
jgi:hypothetical protein